METVRTSGSRPIADRRERASRMARAVQARRRLRPESASGRAWINGREIGGLDPRWAHLARGHD